MKVTICLLMVAYAVAEPPVDTRYLPPQRGSGLSPTRNGGLGFTSRQAYELIRITDDSRGYRNPSKEPQDTYDSPSGRLPYSGRLSFQNSYLPPNSGKQYQPSTQYGTPNAQPSAQYGAPNVQPSTQYGAPNVQLSSQYGAPNARPSIQYVAPTALPSAQYGASNARTSTQYGAPNAAPSTQYGTPNVQLNRLSAPSQEYGVPGFGTGNAVSRADTSATYTQSRQYLPPGGSSYDDGSSGEPANYSFEYSVQDDPSGNDFGHRESRQGDRAEGLYYVQLPDGRTQTVEYEADQGGYKPRISYKDTGIRAVNGGSQQYGYPSGPY